MAADRKLAHNTIAGYEFKNEDLLITALTHLSFCNENGIPAHESNQRLEFLGDAILDAVVGEELFRLMPLSDEGKLTKMRARIVCEQSLGEAAGAIDLGACLFIGRGMELNGHRHGRGVVSDALEAVIGAVYLDSGWEAARSFTLSVFKDQIESVVNGSETLTDHKSMLMELLQSRRVTDFSFKTEREEGPDHMKTFYINFIYEGRVLSSGQGRSKKEAEQMASREAVRLLGEDQDAH